MDKTLHNIFRGLSFVLIALAVILQALVLVKGEEGLTGSSVLDNYAYLAYIALAIAALLALIFPVIFMVQNPKNALKVVIGLAGFVIIGFICYSIAGNSFDIVKLEELETTADVSKMVGAALYFTYIVGGLAVVSILFSGIAGLIKQ
ncbi:MAG: hypothetical protein Kow00127_25110 [Bacteroidales bacterium]